MRSIRQIPAGDRKEMPRMERKLTLRTLSRLEMRRSIDGPRIVRKRMDNVTRRTIQIIIVNHTEPVVGPIRRVLKRNVRDVRLKNGNDDIWLPGRDAAGRESSTVDVVVVEFIGVDFIELGV